MKKGLITGLMMAAAVTAMSALGTAAEETDKVDLGGITFDIPEDVRPLVTVQTEDLEEDMLVSVSETASLEAAAALGEEEDSSAGWLFSISRITEDKLKELRCGDMSGMEVFAEDDDMYYVYNHPTDVRFVREQYDDVDEDMAQWSMLNEWAFGEVRGQILKNNAELEEVHMSNTALDMLFARAAFKGEFNFVLKSLEFRAEPLDPSKTDADEFLEELTEASFEVLDDAQSPDGEYILMELEEEGIRYEFFSADENLIREAHTIDGEEYETFYRAHFEDDDETAEGIMQAWCRAIAGA